MLASAGSATLYHGVAYVQSEVEAKITALETALARGELRVDFADRSVTYRNTRDLIDASGYFKNILADLSAAASPTTSRSRQSFGVACRGL